MFSMPLAEEIYVHFGKANVRFRYSEACVLEM